MPKYVEELVARQVRRSELARQREAEEGIPCMRPVVTISRRMGSGARIAAQKLADDLGWSLWDKELIDAVAQDAHVSRRVVEAFDERTVSEVESLARSMLGDHERGGFIYLRHLAHAVASIAKLGNAIILGRGANFLLPQALNIRIDATDDKRIRNMMTYEGMTREDAAEKLRRSDRERYDFLVSAFGHERVEHARYDLTIMTDEFEVDDVVAIMKTAVERWCIRKGSSRA